MYVSEATKHYRGIYDNRSTEEMRHLAHVKRFMERLTGDAAFRSALAENVENPIVVAQEWGLEIDPSELLPLWRSEYLQYRRAPEGARWPLSVAWDQYMREMITHRDMIRLEGSTADVHPKFDMWRNRHIKRCVSELGGSADAVVHPIVAFELSDGCSVGCWFCGISAERFRGYVPYTEENASLWRGMLGVMQDLFGSAAQTGFCYWATDPCDNPDYDRFIADYYHVTGALPQTTTAAPLKDIELTRRILALFAKYKTVTNRFSVLSVKHLNKIHAAFTPEELMGVELVLQNREALATKAHAGRARERVRKLRAAGKDDTIAKLEADHTTIACVSGFLISMSQRRIQLVSPVPGSDKYPLGYRVFGEKTFSDVDSFREGIESLVEEQMPTEVPHSWPARFRPDLAYHPTAAGFRLQSRCLEHTVESEIWGSLVGELFSSGKHTIGEVNSILLREGVNIFLVAEVFDTLFAAGILAEPDGSDDEVASVPAQAAVLDAAPA